MSVEEVAAAFIQHYYTSLGTNTSALAGLYVRNAFRVFDNIFYCAIYRLDFCFFLHIYIFRF